MKKNKINQQIHLFYLVSILLLILPSCGENNNSRVNNTSNILNTAPSDTVIRNIKVFALDGETILLYDTIKSKTLLFFFDPKNSCVSCLDRIIDFLNELQGNDRHDKVVMITAYENLRYLNIMKDKYNIKFTCFNYNDCMLDECNEYLYGHLFILLNGQFIDTITPIYSTESFDFDNYFYIVKSFLKI
ncbi:MAG: hypothetical protein K0B37_10230 [Bacteroidales bacterium]|nr:hypothetical protein [Bacteroidales bacterium]